MMDRDEIKDLLPDWVGGRLDGHQSEAVEGVVAVDDDLRREADLLRAIARGRDAVPAALRADIVAAVGRERETRIDRVAPSRSGGWRVPVWAMGAAALLAVALGTPSLLERAGPEPDVLEPDALTAVLEGGYTPWVADDGTVAGAPLLDGLSEEELESLLEEIGG